MSELHRAKQRWTASGKELRMLRGHGGLQCKSCIKVTAA